MLGSHAIIKITKKYQGGIHMDDKNNNDNKDLNDNETEPKKISYLAVGIAVGAALGAALKNVGLGLAIGLAIGAGVDSQKSKKNDK